MKSSRPYLLRALYEWIVDSGCTPHILVSSEYPDVRIPAGYARDGQIVLNVSPSAVRYLEMGNDVLTFEGRFGGVAQGLYVPVPAILAIYARENGQGMFFEGDDVPGEDGDDEVPPPAAPAGTPAPVAGKSRSHLKVIK